MEGTIETGGSRHQITECRCVFNTILMGAEFIEFMTITYQRLLRENYLEGKLG
jgi:hypothetical protein